MVNTPPGGREGVAVNDKNIITSLYKYAIEMQNCTKTIPLLFVCPELNG
jgi:hypothetical protein